MRNIFVSLEHCCSSENIYKYLCPALNIQMVEIKARYRIFPLALLLMYMMGSSTLLQFHHHSEAFQKAYEKASSCEKVIHFSHVDQEDCCQHDAHLSLPSVKCSICDHHVFPSYFSAVPSFSFLEQKVTQHFVDLVSVCWSNSPLGVDNRGPPFLFV